MASCRKSAALLASPDLAHARRTLVAQRITQPQFYISLLVTAVHGPVSYMLMVRSWLQTSLGQQAALVAVHS